MKYYPLRSPAGLRVISPIVIDLAVLLVPVST